MKMYSYKEQLIYFTGGKQMTFKKNVLIIFSVFVMIALIFSACSKDSNNNDSVTTDQPSSSSTNTESNKENDTASNINFFGKDSPDDPDITATLLAIELANPNYPAGNNRDDNVWTRYYKETLGLTLVNKEVVPEAQQREKINALIGTNDLPDLMKLETAEFNTAADFDLLHDLTEVYEKYASPLTKKILSSDGGISLNTATVNGKLMGIPLSSNTTGASNVLWIRQDWLNDNGLQIPTTTEELKNVATIFKNKYGMGIPVTAKENLNSFQGLLNSFNVYPSWVRDNNGKLVNGYTTDNAKSALKFLNQLYQEGLIPQEFASDDNITAPLANNQAGIFYWAWWAAYWPTINAGPILDANGEKVPQLDAAGEVIKDSEGNIRYSEEQTADWVAAYIPSGLPNGEQVRLNGSGKPGVYWAVSADFEHPEVLIKMLNQFYEKYAGEQAASDADTFIQGPNDENYWQFAFPFNWDINKDVQNVKAFMEAVESRDESKLEPGGDFGRAIRYTQYKDIIAYLDGERTLNKWQAYSAFGPESAHNIYVEAIENDNLNLGDYFGPTPPTEIEIGGELSKIVLEEYVKMIISKGDLDAEFAAFVDRWNKAGGAQVTKEVNEFDN